MPHRGIFTVPGCRYWSSSRNTVGPTNTRPNFILTSTHRMHSRMHSTVQDLFLGNRQYMARMSDNNPGLLQKLVEEGQQPPFMLIDCSDSRVNEQEIFSAQPGTLFTAANIANRFDENDPNTNAVLSFALESLKVKHIIVLGHYECGGVAAAMVPFDEETPRQTDVAVQSWISPIRHIYETSSRKEIMLYREKSKLEPQSVIPDLHNHAFRALVEENVKSNVQNIANSRVICDRHNAVAEADREGKNLPVAEIYIHGWVYDLGEGKVLDLGVSVGASGKRVP